MEKQASRSFRRHVPVSGKVTAELGHRLAQCRLSRNIPQADLARRAGISTRTLQRLESGSSTLDTLARVLIALDLDQAVLASLPKTTLGPMDRLRGRTRERKRAGAKRDAPPASTWTWGDS